VAIRGGPVLQRRPGVAALLSALLLAAALPWRGQAAEPAVGQRTVTDMAGRQLTIPATIRSVYSTSPMGDILMYTLAPQRAAGVSVRRSADEQRFLLDSYAALPVLGGWYGKDTTGNPEVIIKAKPDIVLSMGQHANLDLSAVERRQSQLGLPVVMVGGELTRLDLIYRFVGALIGEEERAEVLASYCRRTLDEVGAAVATIPREERLRVYYAEGLNGLETDPQGSEHSEVLELAGGINAAVVPLVRGFGRATVSFEQLLVWNPQRIIVALDRGYADGAGNYARVTTDPSWSTVDAVRNGKVYQIPSLPNGWFDRPPSANRVIGLIWLTNLLYPEYYPIDIRAKTREFYTLFYHKTLNDAELAEVLANALAR
jgi:iron complex transport system substrate-binding protein